MFLCYVRVSTDDQAKDDRTSLPEQERMLKGFGMQRGISAFDTAVFRDTVSGSIPFGIRPAASRLMATVKPGDFVVAAKIDRMFRSTLDALQVAEGFKAQGIDLGFLDFMGGDPVTGDGLARCFFTVAAAFATLERDRIRERMQEGKRAKRRKGGHTGGLAPFGWRIEGAGRDARLLPVPEEAQVVKRAQALAKALGVAKATQALNEEGFKNRAGGQFHPMQVYRFIAREKADGCRA